MRSRRFIGGSVPAPCAGTAISVVERARALDPRKDHHQVRFSDRRLKHRLRGSSITSRATRVLRAPAGSQAVARAKAWRTRQPTSERRSAPLSSERWNPHLLHPRGPILLDLPWDGNVQVHLSCMTDQYESRRNQIDDRVTRPTARAPRPAQRDRSRFRIDKRTEWAISM
jgi:hypothetical protein